MERDLDPGMVFAAGVNGEMMQLQSRLLDEKRRYNREYMRRWRSLPKHQEVEQRNRRRCYRRRKALCTEIATQQSQNLKLTTVCAFCRCRPSACTVVRLRMQDEFPYKFEEMRVPYCGEC